MTRPSHKPLPEFATRWAKRERPEGARVAVIVVLYLCTFWGLLPSLLYALGAGLDEALALQPLQHPAWRLIGTGFWVLGACLVVWSTTLFWFVGGGLPISHLPPVRLVKSGPYRVMDHPIYVGYTGGWLGCAMYMGSAGGVVGSTLVLLMMWRLYAVYFEEPILRARFGVHDDKLKGA